MTMCSRRPLEKWMVLQKQQPFHLAHYSKILSIMSRLVTINHHLFFYTLFFNFIPLLQTFFNFINSKNKY